MLTYGKSTLYHSLHGGLDYQNAIIEKVSF